jgi:hypothetical protein
MKKDAEMLRYMRERRKGTNQERAAARAGDLYYDLENKIIAAIKPRPAFLPVLRMLNGMVEYDETRGLLLAEHWCERNRRDSNPRSSA